MLASKQHGLVSERQLRARGAPSYHARRRLQQGRLERLHRGVYRVAGTPSSPEQRLLAAVLACPRGAVASHRSAAELWGLHGVEQGWAEVTVQHSHRLELGNVVIHRTKDLLPRHITTRFGVAVTNPMRTLVDLGAVTPRWSVRRAIDDALAKKLVSMAGLVRIWRDVARPGRNGSGVLRSLIEEHLPHPTASVLEKHMLRLHRAHGLPEPETEYTIHDDQGRFVGRVDFAHPDARIVIEVDGFATHGTPEAFVDDRARDRRLHAMGWTVLRFTWMEVRYTPADVADEIRGFLR